MPCFWSFCGICSLASKAEESLSKTPKSTTSDSNRDSSGFASPQNDNESNPQDKITLQGNLVCHSERSEESLK
ncbi:hypothetical protein, partial [Helicobacter marmotae]